MFMLGLVYSASAAAVIDPDSSAARPCRVRGQVGSHAGDDLMVGLSWRPVSAAEGSDVGRRRRANLDTAQQTDQVHQLHCH